MCSYVKHSIQSGTCPFLLKGSKSNLRTQKKSGLHVSVQNSSRLHIYVTGSRIALSEAWSRYSSYVVMHIYIYLLLFGYTPWLCSLPRSTSVFIWYTYIHIYIYILRHIPFELAEAASRARRKFGSRADVDPRQCSILVQCFRRGSFVTSPLNVK